MSNPSDKLTPEQRAQNDHDERVAILSALHGKDKLSFEIASHEWLGHNSLQLLLNMHGNYNAGWIDDVQFDDALRDRLLAFNRQDLVSTNAIAKSVLHRLSEANRSLKTIKWLLIIIVFLNVVAILAK